MAKDAYSEDLLVQAPTVALLQEDLGWQAVFAQDEEGFGDASLLGRRDDTEAQDLRMHAPTTRGDLHLCDRA